jgi:hypothetical protein
MINKYKYKEAMRKIKFANKKAKVKWNKGEMLLAQDMIIKLLIKEDKNWTPKPNIQSIKEILNGIKPPR